jgi:hypothetical protein
MISAKAILALKAAFREGRATMAPSFGEELARAGLIRVFQRAAEGAVWFEITSAGERFLECLDSTGHSSKSTSSGESGGLMPPNLWERLTQLFFGR